MSCACCFREKPILARGLCAACYQRWQRTGTTDYQRKIAETNCGVGGCEKRVVANGLCDMHRKRMQRHGHMNETRPDDWGAKGWGRQERHPLYNTWANLKRYRTHHPVDPRWSDFLQFVADLGPRPSSKHKLFSANESLPIGPENFVWKRAITERVPGEDEKTYMNRAHKVYRAVRSEAFRGYELKRRFGMDAPDYAKMAANQGGLCAICGNPETAKHKTSGGVRALAVDHCHSSGRVRALLCTACNTGLGSFNDDPDRLKAAIQYLERHKPPS